MDSHTKVLSIPACLYSSQPSPGNTRPRSSPMAAHFLSFLLSYVSPGNIAYFENYDMEVGKMMTSGVDVWLNIPQPPLEASGTSRMKAAFNGVPSLSVLDGWWLEGETGWSIGEKGTADASAWSSDLDCEHRD